MRCMSIYSIQPTPLGAVRTYPLASRKSKVSIRDLAKPPGANSSLTKFLDSLPSILAAEDLRQLLAAVHRARRQRKAILWGIGGHALQDRPRPPPVDLMKNGLVSWISLNRPGALHHFLIAPVRQHPRRGQARPRQR